MFIFAKMKKANLIMLGAPGSGKGTRASAICEVLGIIQVSTGDLFRSNLKAGTPLGKEAESYMNKGELVPDGVTAAMVKERLLQPDAKGGFVLDGFPRTVGQAKLLEEMLAQMGERICAVLYLDVPESELVKRISGRLVCRGCQASFHKDYNPPKVAGVCDKCGGELYTRDDDKPETVKNRLKVFEQNTLPLVDYYRQKGLIVELPPELSPKGALGDMRELCSKWGLIRE